MKKSIKIGACALCVILSTAISSVGVADSASKDSFMIKELECLAKNIYHEAGSEPFEGKVMVAQVSINRASNEKFPDSICGVVSQSTTKNNRRQCQFSWYCNQRKNQAMSPEKYQESYQVAEQVLLNGLRLPKFNSALYFHSHRVSPGWNLQKLGKVGNHVVYTDK